MTGEACAASWASDFEHGASFHGNWPGCVAAEQAQERYAGGEYCPHGCGSIIRHRVGRSQREATRRHTQSPRACRKHPQHRKARRRVRTAAARTEAQVPQAAVQIG